MGKRTTIVLDDDLARKFRILQAKQIKETNASVSLSKIINQVLQKGLK